MQNGILQDNLTVPMHVETKFQMVAVNDIGEFGAGALIRPRNFIGQEIELAGDNLTMGKGAAALFISSYSGPRPRDFTVGIFKFRSTTSGASLTAQEECPPPAGYLCRVVAPNSSISFVLWLQQERMIYETCNQFLYSPPLHNKLVVWRYSMVRYLAYGLLASISIKFLPVYPFSLIFLGSILMGQDRSL